MSKYMAKLRYNNGKEKHFIYECDFRQNSSQHQQYLKDLIYKTFHQHLDVIEIVVKSHATKKDTQKWNVKDMDLYFGKEKWKKVERDMVEFHRILSDDTILLVTDKVKHFEKSEKYALMIANDKCIWLKSWQVKPCYNFWTEEKLYIVKLNKEYFTPYQFKSPINDVEIKGEDKWQDLWEEAKRQETENKKWLIM